MYSIKKGDAIHIVNDSYNVDQVVNLSEDEQSRYNLIKNSMMTAYKNRSVQNMRTALTYARMIYDPNGDINFNINTYLRHDGIMLTWKNHVTQTRISNELCMQYKDLVLSLG